MALGGRGLSAAIRLGAAALGRRGTAGGGPGRGVDPVPEQASSLPRWAARGAPCRLGGLWEVAAVRGMAAGGAAGRPNRRPGRRPGPGSERAGR